MRLPLRPARGLLYGLAAWLAASAVFSWLMATYVLQPILWWSASGLIAVVVLADAIQGLRASRTAALSAKRQIPHALALGVERDVILRIENAGNNPFKVTLFDHFPPFFHAQGLPRELELQGMEQAEVVYRVTPVKRGLAHFSRLELLVDSPLKLWQRRVFLAKEESVRVYPNFAAVAKFALLATDHRLSRLGIRLKRRRGEGREFHQLREYREGDSLRQIDWKATTRQRKLISREYQDERDQRLIFMLDCSRRMRAKDGDLSHFDHALNSLMLLAFVALKQGDSVGAMSFGGVDRYFAPEKGGAALNQLTNALYDIEPQPRTGDYLEAAQRLMKGMPKRSLVVILTNLRDEDEDELGLAIKVLAAKHLVVLASLREEVLGKLIATPVKTLDDALAVASTHNYLEQRRRTFLRLVRRETIALDIEPKRLPIALVNQYLEIKRSGRL
jgi:uncharacterized protein (DUF58 family)